MKIEIRELEIELIPETEHEREAVAKLHKHRKVSLKDGKTTDGNWPPDPKKTNIIICLPDPNKW